MVKFILKRIGTMIIAMFMIILMFGIMTKHNIGIHVKIHHVEKRKMLVITLLIGVKKHLLEFIKIK